MVKEDDTAYRDGPHEYEPGTQREFESRRIPLERVILEVIKRGFGMGRDTLKQTDEALRSVSDSAFAKEAANHVVSQIGDLRQGLSKVIGKEVERYLGRIDLASELRNALKGMVVEGSVKIRFRDADEAGDDEEKKLR